MLTDNVSDSDLIASMIVEARRSEMHFFKKIGAYKKVSSEEPRRSGRRPITVRWIDMSQGDNVPPDYRSMLVA